MRECMQNCLKGMNGDMLLARCIGGIVLWKAAGLSLSCGAPRFSERDDERKTPGRCGH